MVWIIFGIIALAILGMIWIGKEAYKTGERQGEFNQHHVADSCRKEIFKLRREINDLKYQKNNWELRFNEMEEHWRRSKRRREELRIEKLELEAMLSDALSKIP